MAATGPGAAGGAAAEMGKGVNQRAKIRMTDEEIDEFLHGKHTMSLASINADGSIHLVAMWYGFLEGEIAFETKAKSQKVANLRRNPVVAVCQVDRGRWSTIEGRAEVRDDAGSVAEAVRRYAERYRQPRENPDRVAIRITITSVIGNV